MDRHFFIIIPRVKIQVQFYAQSRNIIMHDMAITQDPTNNSEQECLTKFSSLLSQANAAFSTDTIGWSKCNDEKLLDEIVKDLPSLGFDRVSQPDTLKVYY